MPIGKLCLASHAGEVSWPRTDALQLEDRTETPVFASLLKGGCRPASGLLAALGQIELHPGQPGSSAARSSMRLGIPMLPKPSGIDRSPAPRGRHDAGLPKYSTSAAPEVNRRPEPPPPPPESAGPGTEPGRKTVAASGRSKDSDARGAS